MKSRMFNPWLPVATLLLVVGAVSGCATQQTNGKDAAPTEASSTDATALPADGQTEARALDEGARKLAKVIYFDYDQADVKPEFRDVVSAHAAFLRNNPQAHLKLGGHADERGSREYNLALSERRVKAVIDQLRVAGVSEAQLTSTAYGEEYPAVQGHDEAAWSKNRRVEFDYQGADSTSAR